MKSVLKRICISIEIIKNDIVLIVVSLLVIALVSVLSNYMCFQLQNITIGIISGVVSSLIIRFADTVEKDIYSVSIGLHQVARKLEQMQNNGVYSSSEILDDFLFTVKDVHYRDDIDVLRDKLEKMDLKKDDEENDRMVTEIFNYIQELQDSY